MLACTFACIQSREFRLWMFMFGRFATKLPKSQCESTRYSYHGAECKRTAFRYDSSASHIATKRHNNITPRDKKYHIYSYLHTRPYLCHLLCVSYLCGVEIIENISVTYRRRSTLRMVYWLLGSDQTKLSPLLKSSSSHQQIRPFCRKGALLTECLICEKRHVLLARSCSFW